MDFESKVISREVSEILWETEKTVGTAESCTGGRIAEAIIAVPGASKYFKGGIISYVKGACKTLNTDYAISATGFAGPSGGTKDIPVGTIWLACGSPERVVTLKVQEDHGRDINLAIATNVAMELFLKFLKEENAPRPVREG